MSEVLDDERQCVCQPGYVRNSSGGCVEGTSARDKCANRGLRWSKNRCLPVPVPDAAVDAEIDCEGGGRIWTGSRCIDSRQRSSSQTCRASGGVWNGVRCNFRQGECGRGYTGIYPNCRLNLPAPLRVPKSCPFGKLGVYPNCFDELRRCPNGRLGVPGSCR